MADSFILQKDALGVSKQIATDLVSSTHTQKVAATITGGTLPVTDNAGSLTVDDGGITLSVDDGGSSITIDGSAACTSLPAAAPATDGAVTYAGTGRVYFDNGSGFTACTVKYATISRATNADGAAVVNLVSAKSIVVTSVALICAGASGVKWQSATSNSTGAGSNTDLSAVMSFAANGGYVLPNNPHGWFKTVAGEGLKLNSNSTNQVSGHLTYFEL